MSAGRWVVLGLAHPRADWFTELARWATSATVPIDFVKCMSASEARSRLSTGRAFSALLVGDRMSGFDRDLVADANAAGTAVIIVDPVADRDWADLDVAGVLHWPFGRDELLSTLQQHSTPVEIVTDRATATDAGPISGSWQGRLIAVTGAGGVGKSITAMALSQALSAKSGNRGMLLLADLALDADLAMLHDARDVVPGIQELIDGHRNGRMTVERTRSMVFDTGERGYHLLLGLRRHRDWTVLRSKSFEASLDTMMRSYRIVVCDVTNDLEGESETGSMDIADRNLMARTATQRADLVVAVGTHGMKGIHSLARTIRDLLAHEIEPERLITIINRAPRHPSRRSDITVALAALLESSCDAGRLAGPLFIPERRDLESALRDGTKLPAALCAPIGREAQRRLEELPSRGDDSHEAEPQRVVPGSIGSWTEEAG